MHKFIKHAIIRNKKAFYRMDGRLFKANLLFKILYTHDFYDTFVAQCLNDPRPPKECIRLVHNSPELLNFEVIT